MYVDLFFDTKPTEAIHPTKVNALYAIKFCKNAKGEYWHCLATDAQYAYRVANSLPGQVWSDAIKTKTKIVKKISAAVGGLKDCPEHVFGTFISDPKAKKLTVASAEKDVDLSIAPVIK